MLARLDRSLSALEHNDTDAAEEVIQGDDEINQQYLDLESKCIDLFALQQPVASDLRFIAASFKILTDLERIGDLAANLGEYTLSMGRDPVSDVALYDIGTAAHELVDYALEAYVTEDATACRRVAEGDDHIDAVARTGQ